MEKENERIKLNKKNLMKTNQVKDSKFNKLSICSFQTSSQIILDQQEGVGVEKDTTWHKNFFQQTQCTKYRKAAKGRGKNKGRTKTNSSVTNGY